MTEQGCDRSLEKQGKALVEGFAQDKLIRELRAALREAEAQRDAQKENWERWCQLQDETWAGWRRKVDEYRQALRAVVNITPNSPVVNKLARDALREEQPRADGDKWRWLFERWKDKFSDVLEIDKALDDFMILSGQEQMVVAEPEREGQ